jgi:hypothetical protein
MYSYRELRLVDCQDSTKLQALYPSRASGITFRQSAVEHLTLPLHFDALITSPPYMNALDYGRDNCLRLWFIDEFSGTSRQ